MRHRVTSHHFNRDTNHRKLLLRNLVRALVEHGEIVTTEVKAKETRRLADRLIHRALTHTFSLVLGMWLIPWWKRSRQP